MADSRAYCIRVFVVVDPEEVIWMVVGSHLIALAMREIFVQVYTVVFNFLCEP